MARMRSIKPEFWSDQDLTRYSRDARMLYMALWNFADEEARLPGDPRLVKSWCFPLDDDLTADAISTLLDVLEKAGKVVRYEVDGALFLHLPRLADHQKLDPRLKSRFPAPTDLNLNTGSHQPHTDQSVRSGVDEENGLSPAETPPTMINTDQSVLNSDESVLARAGAGSREHVASSREQVAGVPTTSGALALRDEPPPTTTQTIVGEWIDRCDKRPPKSTVARVGKHISELLAEGIDPDDVRRGMAVWKAKGLDPSTLPSVVNQVMNAAPPGRKPSTTDQRVADALEAGMRLAAAENS